MYILALDLPSCNAFAPPAPFAMRFIMNEPSAVNSSMGSTQDIMKLSMGDC